MCKCHTNTQLKQFSFLICTLVMSVITSSLFKYKGNCVYVDNFEL